MKTRISALALVAALMAVSYTHLDVYKRQDHVNTLLNRFYPICPII